MIAVGTTACASSAGTFSARSSPAALLGTLLATFVIFLHEVDRLFELLVGSNAEARDRAAAVRAGAFRRVLPLTIPFGVLVGILIGLGRLSSDGEIIAMRAAGVSSRKVIAPVLLFAALGTALAGLCFAAPHAVCVAQRARES